MVLAAAPERAEAQGGLAGLGEGLAIVIGIGSGVIVGVPTLIFTVADIVSFSANTPFHPAWAVVETISAGLTLIAGGITAAIGIVDVANDGDGVFLGIAVPVLALGGFNLAHAIWSFVNHGSTATEVPISAYLVPQRDGALAAVGGTF